MAFYREGKGAATLTSKPAASSSLDRVSLVPTADSWAARSGSPVFSAVGAGSAGLQISAPSRASAHRYVAVWGLLDLTLSSPWIVFYCLKFDMAASLPWLVACEAVLIDVRAMRPVFNFSRANESIPSLLRRARSPATEQSIWFPCCTLIRKRKQTDL